jgi:hypothetical protein
MAVTTGMAKGPCGSSRFRAGIWREDNRGPTIERSLLTFLSPVARIITRVVRSAAEPRLQHGVLFGGYTRSPWHEVAGGRADFPSYRQGFTMLRIKNVILTGAFALALPAVAVAQQQMPAPAMTPAQQQEVEQVLTELRQVNAKLEAIREKAMADPQLQSRQEALGNEVKAAMEKADPELPRSLARAAALDAEAIQAQQASDAAKLQKLAQEAEAIRMRFDEARYKALSQPEVAAKLDAFQSSVEARMTQVDPEAPSLIKRFQDLEDRLASHLSAAAAPR